jgi:hypothetical protein
MATIYIYIYICIYMYGSNQMANNILIKAKRQIIGRQLEVVFKTLVGVSHNVLRIEMYVSTKDKKRDSW